MLSDVKRMNLNEYQDSIFIIFISKKAKLVFMDNFCQMTPQTMAPEKISNFKI